MWKKLLTVDGGREFVRHVVPAILKPARTLWNEVIGFFFLCFAVFFGFSAAHTYVDFVAAPPELALKFLGKLMALIFFSLLMLYFGVTNFLRARKISRS